MSIIIKTNMNGMKGIILVHEGELSDKAKAKLKKLEENKKKRIEKIREDYRTGKLIIPKQ